MKLETTISLKGSANAEFMSSIETVHFSEYGEHIFRLTFDEIDLLKSEVDKIRCQKSEVSKIMGFYKKVID